MFKKILLLSLTLLVILLVGITYGLKSIGINPLLWLSMPEQSSFQGQASGSKISIQLQQVAQGFSQITDMQFFPDSEHKLLVLQKSGELIEVNLEQGSRQQLATIPVLTASEQGLLGVAIHPDFPRIPCIYLNYVLSKHNKDTSRVAEWCVSWEGSDALWYENKVVFELEQPYRNHNAGHLIFDAQGLLYIPWGDGGSGGDPQNYAQNLQSYLGKVLRINPEAFNNELAYSIPADNPFVGDESIPAEIYAWGLRNPWKLSFDPQGRLIAADVGQDKWEEVTFILAGRNHGWNQVEGTHCFKQDCAHENTVFPFIEYGHDLGRSITGGYVYLGKRIPQLSGKYIYGDFVSGQLWAADLPEQENPGSLNTEEHARSYTPIYQLGQWPLLISTFARDGAGEIYVADFARGAIFKISPTSTSNNEVTY